MAPAGSSKNNPTKLPYKASIWNTEDLILSGTVLFGILGVTLLCFYTPVKDFTVKPIEAMLGKSKSDTKVESRKDGKGFWTGVYSLGEMMMSLGRKDEYLDSEIDIEYNGHLLTLRSNGKVEDERSANRYLKREEAKLRDALVMGSSQFTGKEVNKGDGMNQFKNEMVTALNRKFDDVNIITNIYFKRFVLFSENMEEVN